MNNLKVGQRVIYKGHGLATVSRIEEKTICGITTNFYVLSTQHNMTLVLPTPSADTLIRPIVSEERAKEIVEFIKTGIVKISDETCETWNRRFRQQLEILKNGDLFEIATLYKALLLLRNEKDLSFGERKMLDQAKELLIAELAIALQIKNEQLIVLQLLSA